MMIDRIAALAVLGLALLFAPAARAQVPTAVLTAPPTGTVGVAVNLSGASSFDIGGTIVQYRWTPVLRPAGATAFPVEVVTAGFSFSFTPDALGRWRVQLVVVDDSGNHSLPVLADIIVADSQAPTAVLTAPTTMVRGVAATLGGASSFDTGGGRIVQYRWSAPQRPPGATAFASQVQTATPEFTFTPDVAGTWTFQLVVVDDSGNQSSPTQLQRTVIVPDTTNPTAVLTAPSTGSIGVAVNLSGASSFDVGGAIVQYRWAPAQRPAGAAAFPNEVVTASATFSFTPDRLGAWDVRLVVVDDSGNQSEPTTARIVVADTQAPTAVLNVTASLEVGVDAILSSSGSFDTGGGTIITYIWSAPIRPAGATALGTGVVTSQPYIGFTPDRAGAWTFELVVVDDSGNQSSPVQVQRTVLDALPPGGDFDGDGIPNGIEPVEGRDPRVKDNDVFGDARLFAMQMYRDFLGREGDPAGIDGWVGLLKSGSHDRARVIDAFLGSPEFGGFVAPVVRLYFATFLRVPDYDGLVFNASLVRQGKLTVAELAGFFTGSPEFQKAYGSLDDGEFVKLLYANVLGREADAAGLDGWVKLLGGGMSRGQVLVGFSESPEYQAALANEVFTTMMYAGMLRRTPEPAGFSGWVGFLDEGKLSREQVIQGFFLSSEYRKRFLP